MSVYVYDDVPWVSCKDVTVKLDFVLIMIELELFLKSLSIRFFPNEEFVHIFLQLFIISVIQLQSDGSLVMDPELPICIRK